jgi:hypothetical protein
MRGMVIYSLSTFFSIMDSVVASIIAKFRIRSEIGKKKYGTDLDRTDLSVLDWINHAQEEHMDAILYLEKLKQTLVGVTLEKK